MHGDPKGARRDVGKYNSKFGVSFKGSTVTLKGVQSSEKKYSGHIMIIYN